MEEVQASHLIVRAVTFRWLFFLSLHFSALVFTGRMLRDLRFEHEWGLGVGVGSKGLGCDWGQC